MDTNQLIRKGQWKDKYNFDGLPESCSTHATVMSAADYSHPSLYFYKLILFKANAMV